MSFADLLDESIRLWRQHWVSYALISAIGFLPPGLVLVWLGADFAGQFQRTFLADVATGRAAMDQFASQIVGAFGAYFVVAIIFQLLWTAAVIAATDAYLRGVDPNVG